MNTNSNKIRDAVRENYSKIAEGVNPNGTDVDANLKLIMTAVSPATATLQTMTAYLRHWDTQLKS